MSQILHFHLYETFPAVSSCEKSIPEHERFATVLLNIFSYISFAVGSPDRQFP